MYGSNHPENVFSGVKLPNRMINGKIICLCIKRLRDLPTGFSTSIRLEIKRKFFVEVEINF